MVARDARLVPEAVRTRVVPLRFNCCWGSAEAMSDLYRTRSRRSTSGERELFEQLPILEFLPRVAFRHWTCPAGGHGAPG